MSRARDVRLAALGLALFALGCRRPESLARATTAADASVVATSDAAADAQADAAAEVIPGSWPSSMRAGRYAEAAHALAALPAPDLARPEIRLARARAALMIGNAAEALGHLERLDDELPLVRDLVADMRAQAAFEAGPFERAAELYSSRADAASLARAAEAWDKAGDAVKARAAWERVLGAQGRSRAQEEKARHRRLQITRLKDGDAAASQDAIWLATNALDDATFGEAAELLEKLSPQRLLTPDELLQRSRVLADAGRSDEAIRAIERAASRASAKGKRLGAVDLCRLKAEVLWKARTRYVEAAHAYRQCAALGGAHAAEDRFLSARSFTRALRDGDAMPAFQAVIQRHPRTTWAEQAEFQIARGHALAGRWKEAATAFDAYAKRWSNGKEGREAERYRALAHLMSRHDKKARRLLEDLAGGAEDPVTRARWTNLAALAAFRDGDKLHALARWAEVARSRPLTYPALIARARLLENGSALPPAIDPADAGAAAPRPAVQLPPPVDLLHRIGLEAEAEEALRAREASIVAKGETRRVDALCAAYGMLDRGKRLYRISQQVPSQQLGTAPGDRNRGAWECVYPRPHGELVRSAAQLARIAPELVWAVMRQESAFDPEVVSPARAVGLMQLLPETARATAAANGVTLEDAKLTSPAQNIRLGALYLREMLGTFGERLPLAVAAYNAGPDAIHRWLAHAQGETIDVFVETIPFIETRGYVARVLGNLARYGYLAEGEAGVPQIDLTLK